MKNYFFLIIFIFLAQSMLFSQQEQDAFLRIDPRSHMDRINDITSTSDGKYIISCSSDKTIRIWDVERGIEVRKILGESGNGDFGKIFTIALSPDNKILATGGCFGPLDSDDDNDTGKIGIIRIYNFDTGSLLKVIFAHKNKINDLAFSSDGKYLVSGSHDMTAKVWDVLKDYSLVHTFEDHEDHVYSVDILKNKDDYRVLSASLDNMLYMYSLDSGTKIGEYKAYDDIDSIAVCESTGMIAVNDWRGFIYVFNIELERIKKISEGISAIGLAFSQDGQYLICGNAREPYYSYLFNTNNDFRFVSKFFHFDNLVKAVNFLDNDRVIIGGGSEYDIAIWEISTGEIKNLTVSPTRISDIGVDGNRIYFGTEKHFYDSQGKIDAFYDLSDFSISRGIGDVSMENIKRNIKKLNDFSFAIWSGGKYNLPDARLAIRKDDVTVSIIERDEKSGYEHTAVTFTEKGLIISGGKNGYMAAYNTMGGLIGELVGHTGTILSLAIDGNRLVSCAGDLSICIWNLEELTTGKNLKPMLSLFVSDNDEWVIWSKSGYYHSSLEGDKFIGYHVNQGPEKEALYYSSDKFFKLLYRPNIIKAIVEFRNEDKALENINTEKRSEISIKNVLPPLINISEGKTFINTSDDAVKIDFSVIKQSEHKITEVMILRNGRPIFNPAREIIENSSQISITETIPIIEETTIITLIAKNEFAMSNPLSITVKKNNLEPVTEDNRPDLFILSIGVSAYENTKLNLEYADKDAESIIDVFENNTGNLYHEIDGRLVINEIATKDKILESLESLKKNAGPEDITVIFIAGHGTNDELGNYYYLNYDVDLEDLYETGVFWVSFKRAITELSSKVIFIIDTCKSGNVWGKKSDTQLNTVSAIKYIASEGTGQIIMTAATTDTSSFEGFEWGHGVFTYSIIEAIEKGLADYDNDNFISMKELDFYVTMRVKSLTNGKQQPTTIIPDSIPDFNIAAIE